MALSLYLPGAVMAFCNGMLVPVMPLYARSLDASYFLVGVVLSGAAFGALACDLPAGLLVQRLGTRRVMLLGGGGTLAAVAGLAWTDSVWAVLGYRVLAGVGMALWGIGRHAYVAALIRTARRGRSISVLGGIGRLGLFLGPAAGGTVAQAYGLRAPFLLYAGLGLVALAAVAIWVENPTTDEIAASRQPLTAILSRHAGVLAAAGSGQLFAQMIRRARHIIIPLYAADVIGLHVQAVGLLISVAAAVDMLMFYPAGLLMDRRGRKWAYVPSFTIQALGMLLVPTTHNLLGLAAVACLVGLGNGLGSGTMMVLGADLAPARARGQFLGLWRFIGDVGSTASPLVIGSLAAALGLAFTPVLMTGIGLTGASIMLFLVPETLHREARSSASGNPLPGQAGQPAARKGLELR